MDQPGVYHLLLKMEIAFQLNFFIIFSDVDNVWLQNGIKHSWAQVMTHQD